MNRNFKSYCVRVVPNRYMKQILWTRRTLGASSDGELRRAEDCGSGGTRWCWWQQP